MSTEPDAAIGSGPRRRVRRRPSGEPPPLPREPGWSGWAWAAAGVLFLGILLTLTLRTSGEATSFDRSILEAFADLRTPALTSIADALYLPTGLTGLIVLRLAVVVVLLLTRRFRHLVVFLAALVVTDWIVARPLSVDLPAPGVPVLAGDGTFGFPSTSVAAFAVTLGAMAFALIPRGRSRTWFWLGSHLSIAVVMLIGAYLAADYPTAMVYSWALSVVVAQVAFRWLVPEDVFPVTYGHGGNAAHLDLGGARRDAIVHAMYEQLGLTVTDVEPFGLEGSGGSSPLRMTLEDGTRVFGKIYATSHARADRWYRIFRTILYGQLEDETPMGSVRRLVTYEHYALLCLTDADVRVAHVYGVVELTPNREYLLVTEFFEHAKNLGDSDIDDTVIDEGFALVRQLWDVGVAHRDIKPANLLVQDGHLQLVDVSALEVRPSPWRQAVDLANMMLTLALRTDPDRVYQRALMRFTDDEIAEAFASTVGLTVPTELQTKLEQDGRPLLARFRELAPSARPILIQRWSVRRLALTFGVALGVLVTAGLFVDALRAGT
jgi:tRNA A-37 threonylcarbamoyl transferase component Bud32